VVQTTAVGWGSQWVLLLVQLLVQLSVTVSGSRWAMLTGTRLGLL
jgi:hypothetical protein